MRSEYDFSSEKKNPYAVKPDRQVSNAFENSAIENRINSS